MQRVQQGRNELQPVRDAGRWKQHPPGERQQGRRLPAALPRQRAGGLYALGVSRAELGFYPVAVGCPARWDRGRRDLQATLRQSLVAGKTCARFPAAAAWRPSPRATTRWPWGPLVVVDPAVGINTCRGGIAIVTPLDQTAGGRHGRPYGARGGSARPGRVLRNPLAALGPAVPRGLHLRQQDHHAQRLRPVPGRRAGQQGACAARPGDLLLHADSAPIARSPADPGRRDGPRRR